MTQGIFGVLVHFFIIWVSLCQHTHIHTGNEMICLERSETKFFKIAAGGVGVISLFHLGSSVSGPSVSPRGFSFHWNPALHHCQDEYWPTFSFYRVNTVFSRTWIKKGCVREFMNGAPSSRHSHVDRVEFVWCCSLLKSADGVRSADFHVVCFSRTCVSTHTATDSASTLHARIHHQCTPLQSVKSHRMHCRIQHFQCLITAIKSVCARVYTPAVPYASGVERHFIFIWL